MRFSLGSDDRSWARWNRGLGVRYTIGVEEEVMLLDDGDGSLAERSDGVLAELSDQLAGHVSPETHAAVVELVTGVHATVAGASGELAALRERLLLELRPLGVVAAGAGMHPSGRSGATRVSAGERYRVVAESLGFLAHREPTLALHVHVGVPDAQDATRVLNRLRESLPLLLALAANSPFSEGRDSGFASARTMIFGGFPRTGAPRAFASYGDYVGAVDALVASGASPCSTFVWWDVRLQPALGTVEVRVMDAQATLAHSAPLIALVQSLARLELDREPDGAWVAPEILAENRFLAARDGPDARLVDPVSRRLVPVRTLLDEVVRDCRPHAAALGCAAELEAVGRLARDNGAARQRRRALETGGIPSVASMLVEDFVARRELALHPMDLSERSDACVAGLPTAVPPSC